MENSIGLGLLHGLVYGIVPVAPWFVALKRYLLEGKEKGQLAVAGTIAGQVMLLALTFFGWSPVLWIWYYFEPALVIVGTMAVVRCALDCWLEQASSLQTTAVPLTDKKEGFYYFLVNFGLMFCNPAHLEGSQTLISSIPGNRYFYLMAFTLTYSAVILGFWATIGYRIFGRAYSGFGAQQTLNRYRIRRVAVGMVAALFVQFLNCTPETFILYHFDSLLTYAPFGEVKHHRTRGYIWETDEADLAENPETNLDEKKWKSQSYKSTNRAGITIAQEARNYADAQPMWNTEERYEECNTIRERELTNEEFSEELTFHEFEGINAGANKKRLIPFHLYMLPKWEQQENKEFLSTLSNMRVEMDDQLISHGTTKEQRTFLPHSGDWQKEVDYWVDEEGMQSSMDDPVATQAGLNEMRKFARSHKWTFNNVHLGNGNDTEVSYGKLHKLPAEVRLPWHYPAVKTVDDENLLTGDQVIARNAQLQENVNFLANEPVIKTQDLFKRLWEYRTFDKSTPRENPEELARRLEKHRAVYSEIKKLMPASRTK
jgi:hypothetical protein